MLGLFSIFFFFNDPATTEIYTLSLHDALPILYSSSGIPICWRRPSARRRSTSPTTRDRKSTRLNSSHQIISYAVFCLKKKNPIHLHTHEFPDVIRPIIHRSDEPKPYPPYHQHS